MTLPDDKSRWLSPAGAALYLSVRIDALPRLVRQARIPAPSYALGKRSPRWDKRALDAALDGDESSGDMDWAVDEIVSKLRKNQAEARRARR